MRDWLSKNRQKSGFLRSKKAKKGRGVEKALLPLYFVVLIGRDPKCCESVNNGNKSLHKGLDIIFWHNPQKNNILQEKLAKMQEKGYYTSYVAECPGGSLDIYLETQTKNYGKHQMVI
ncbi:MAG: hypothetical protein IJ751_03525 [Oscillospiraceae bacterium]|nr:hypothetical protein [Oscillospiraceae bacterium]